MNFSAWLESTENEAEWRRAFDQALLMRRDWGNRQGHNTLIRQLRTIGLHDEANGLELVRPSDEDIKFGDTPIGGIGGTVGDVLDYKQRRGREDSFRAAHRAYTDALEDIANKIDEKAVEMGWHW